MEINPDDFELLAPVTLAIVAFRIQVADLEILLDEIRIVGRSLCRS